MKKNNDIKYLIKSNNYVGLLFFALVLASLLYILKTETISLKKEPIIDETSKNIDSPITIYETPNEDINEYLKYLNPGNQFTYETYESNYAQKETKATDFNLKSLLYIAFNYLIQSAQYNTTRPLTCEEASIINLTSNIIECGGTADQLSQYQVYPSITKQLLKNTISDLYNINITEYDNFYITNEDMCHYRENEYICVRKNFTTPTDHYGQTTFIKAYEYENTLEIVEKYSYISNGQNYQLFASQEVGESYFISTFQKINGKYRYQKTEIYKEN